MDNSFNMAEYMNKGIENIVMSIIKASLRNPKETAFVMKYTLSSKEAMKKRSLFESKGYNIPPFLICSITSNCNLFCKGCYARANNSCGEDLNNYQLTTERWDDIFKEAKELGISFILLAGGEPFMRMAVIEKAKETKEIIFPIFTNGTIMNESYIQLFNNNRNLVPIISIEGDKFRTDERRGVGTYDTLMATMDALKEKGILFGASVTVTTKNINTVISKGFVDKLYNKGCKALIYVEYVPVTYETRELAPTDVERKLLEKELKNLRLNYEDVIFLAFPGDEKHTGGCLAAGRGFFHINVSGGVEPCPFSPYSDTNLKDCTLIEAIKSPLFKKLNESDILLSEHSGGCVLFELEEEVKKFVKS